VSTRPTEVSRLPSFEPQLSRISSRRCFAFLKSGYIGDLMSLQAIPDSVIGHSETSVAILQDSLSTVCRGRRRSMVMEPMAGLPDLQAP